MDRRAQGAQGDGEYMEATHGSGFRAGTLPKTNMETHIGPCYNSELQGLVRLPCEIYGGYKGCWGLRCNLFNGSGYLDIVQAGWSGGRIENTTILIPGTPKTGT